jgi:hypothetical protein
MIPPGMKMLFNTALLQWAMAGSIIVCACAQAVVAWQVRKTVFDREHTANGAAQPLVPCSLDNHNDLRFVS